MNFELFSGPKNKTTNISDKKCYLFTSVVKFSSDLVSLVVEDALVDDGEDELLLGDGRQRRRRHFV
jgi:hypothetical protein